MGFDWNTDDETIWEERTEAPAEAPQGRSWVPWLKGLLVLLLVSGAVYAVYRQVNQRVEAAVEAVEEEVRSSHALAQRAAQTGDRELLVPLLSGRDSDWTEVQKRLLDASLLFDHAATPFGLVPQDDDPAVVDVTFSPELDEAELLAVQQYMVDGRETTTVTLRQPLVYRRGADRWLHSPPTEAFWGEMDTLVHDRLLLTYPGRDAEVARRLAQDLDDWLADLCALSGVNCPGRWQMDVTLVTDPDSLAILSSPLAMLRGGQGMELPAPSLIGLPADDAAYRALAQGYAGHVLASALGDGIGWQCCDHSFYYRALLSQQLQAMGVWGGPGPAAGLVANADHLLDLELAGDLWSQDEHEMTPANDLLARTFVAFALAHAETETTPLALMALLQNSSSLSDWVAQATPFGSLRDEALREAWRDFVAAKVAEAQQTRATPPLPDQDLWLACEDGQRYGVYRYHLATDTWERMGVYGEDLMWMVALAGDDGLVMTGIALPDGGPDRVETILWRDGEQSVLAMATETEGDFYLPLGPAGDPTGRYLLAIRLMPEPNDEFGLVLLDLASCDPAGCEWIDVPGLPLWSPDGTRVIGFNPEDNQLFLGAGALDEWAALTSRTETLVMSAFWLGNDTIGMVASGPNAGIRLVPATGDGPPRTVLTDDGLLAALGEAGSSRLLSVRFARPRPSAGQELIILADDFGSHTQTFAFAARPGAASWAEATPETVTVDFLFKVMGYTVDPFFLMPLALNERWLAYAGASDQGRFLLYDLEAREVVLNASNPNGFWPQGHDWSGDGRWLARPGDGYLDFIAPGGDDGSGLARHLVFHDFEQCASVAWINR